MNRVVCNASPLIYLAKANRVGLLKKVFREVLIPTAVYEEVVIEGKRLKERDAYRIERGIEEEWIIVEHVKNAFPLEIEIHPGEAEVISLAKEKGIETVLIDDAKARVVCETVGLRPIGTLGVMLRAVKDHMLSFNEFLSTLEDMVSAGFYLKEDVYMRAVREAQNLVDNQSRS